MTKKIQLIALIIPLSILMVNCSSARKGKSEYVEAKKISYTADVKPIIANSCTPCHMPPQGRKEPFENYEQVKAHITAIIARVKLPQDDRKFMPPVNKKPALTNDQVALLVQWQQQNMPQ
ncbi:hypothetical protein EOD40_03765 [Flavobacterium sufflavum]|uniref:Cytochrome c domain-containing protein n=1 Tax=Flavobacterium sufflavum TaxID=1921138 RepID=A0A3S2U7X6_9FLAO|nr:hypothetical protein [Flavobacterium sufflavum]RVT78363.1 hypothetical protein EOD40_03765 [Flavobacterium sufflavum]